MLFGSLAQKRAIPGSDADILVILEKSEKPLLERIEEWIEKLEINHPIEVFPYTEKELNTPIAREALEKGVTLYEKQQTLKTTNKNKTNDKNE